MMWFDLKIGDTLIGNVEVRRQEPLDLTDQAAIQNEVCTYRVTRDGESLGLIKHRYGDGAWKLLEKVAQLIALQRPGIPGLRDRLPVTARFAVAQFYRTTLLAEAQASVRMSHDPDAQTVSLEE